MNDGINTTNQLPNQPPNLLPNQLPNNLVTGNNIHNISQWSNVSPYAANVGSSSASSATAVAAWLQNNPVGRITEAQTHPRTQNLVGSSRTTPWLPHTQPQSQAQSHPQAQNPVGSSRTTPWPPQTQTQPQSQAQIHPQAQNLVGSIITTPWPPQTQTQPQTHPQAQNPVGSSRTTTWHPYQNSGSPYLTVSRVLASSSPSFPGSVLSNGTYNYGASSIPHSLHFHTYGAPSSSSTNVATGNQQNNGNALGNLFPVGPAQTTAVLNNVAVTVTSLKRANASPTDTSPKKPRGRLPKKEKTTKPKNAQISTSAALQMALSLRPAAFATMPTTQQLGLHQNSIISDASGTPSTSTSTKLHAPSEYVPPMNSRPVLTAAMPIPPNWLANMEHSVMSLLTFNKYEIKEDTAEYRTISDMLYPIGVRGVEQIVNPDLWDRFVKTRTDMIRSKADDLNVLTKLGLSEKEVMRCAHLSINFRKDPLLIPYSDNMVLLYHCTRSNTNINSILSQGLDERLSSTSAGLLGKGIYFADDPSKSLQYDGTGYIFIFAVLLGDCISVDHFLNQRAFVREPEKVAQQKRNFNDQFFDSIVARPGKSNEYVIYNRYQCCPIYQVRYDLSAIAASSSSTIFRTSSKKLPPIAWLPSEQNYAMPIQDQKINWPFFAVDIFTSMGTPPPTDDDDATETVNNDEAQQNTSQNSIDDNLVTLTNLGFNDETKNREILSKFNNDLDQAVNYYLDNGSPAVEDVTVNATEATTIQDNSINTSAASETDMLISLGFCDEAKNREVLAKFNNDVGQAINYFLDNVEDEWKNGLTDSANVTDGAGSASANGNQASNSTNADKSIVTIDLIDDDSDCPVDEKPADTTAVTDSIPTSGTDLPEDIAEWALNFGAKLEDQDVMEECTICCDESSSSSWQTLDCKHKLCAACYSKLLTSRSTMSGVRHTFVKCPFCHAIMGTQIGDCPDMKMRVSVQSIACEGSSTFSTLVIEYVGQKFKRTAYLPNDDVGADVLKLLQIAFDRRLCFTVGTSNTTGRENAIVWNIHHKTATHGGVASYGYPDPEYFDRVKSELKAFGIE